MSDQNTNFEAIIVRKIQPRNLDENDSPRFHKRQRTHKKPKHLEQMAAKAREKTRNYNPKERRKLAKKQSSLSHPILKQLSKLRKENNDHGSNI